jgi:hypothetical protein
MNNGKYMLVLLYVNDVLVMLELSSDRRWVKDVLEEKYKKVTMIENTHLPYLGMAIIKT